MPYKSDMLMAKSWFVYVVEECQEDDTAPDGRSHTGFYKIGTASNVKYRLSGLISGNPMILRVVFERDLGSINAARAVEKLAHRNCPGRVRMTEWFETDKDTVFEVIEDAIDRVKPLIRHNGEYVGRINV